MITGQNKVLFRALTAALIFSALLSNMAFALRLDTVARINTKYDPNKQVLSVSWDSVRNAGKYQLSVRDFTNTEISSTSSKRNSINLPESLFTEDQKYIIEVVALKNSSYASSKSKRKILNFSNKVRTEEKTGTFSLTNSGGRNGQYFLPKNYRLKAMPLLVVFHGSNISGSNVLKLFKEKARSEGFIILAPDSSDPRGWHVPEKFDEPSEDQSHFYGVLNELKSLPHLNFMPDKIMIAGISAGGAMSAFLGSQDSQFSHIAVLHGGLYTEDFGSTRVPFWLSTGSQDTLRTPSELKSYQIALQALGFPQVDYNEYNAAHQVLSDEVADILNWWLK